MIYRFIGLRLEITEICSINRKHRWNWTVTLCKIRTIRLIRDGWTLCKGFWGAGGMLPRTKIEIWGIQTAGNTLKLSILPSPRYFCIILNLLRSHQADFFGSCAHLPFPLLTGLGCYILNVKGSTKIQSILKRRAEKARYVLKYVNHKNPLCQHLLKENELHWKIIPLQNLKSRGAVNISLSTNLK